MYLSHSIFISLSISLSSTYTNLVSDVKQIISQFTASPQPTEPRRVKRLADKTRAILRGHEMVDGMSGDWGRVGRGHVGAGERLQSGKDATRPPDTVITAPTLLPRRTLNSLNGNIHLPPLRPLHPFFSRGRCCPPTLMQPPTPQSSTTFQGQWLGGVAFQGRRKEDRWHSKHLPSSFEGLFGCLEILTGESIENRIEQCLL